MKWTGVGRVETRDLMPYDDTTHAVQEQPIEAVEVDGTH